MKTSLVKRTNFGMNLLLETNRKNLKSSLKIALKLKNKKPYHLKVLESLQLMPGQVGANYLLKLNKILATKTLYKLAEGK